MSDFTKQQIDEIVRQLEIIKRRPQMYMDERVLAVENFLNGFLSACGLFGTHLFDRKYRNVFLEVQESRGWEHLSGFLSDQMKNAGLSDDESTQEMLAIYIEVWRRVGDTLSQE